MKPINWNSVPDQQDYQRPVPGGYIAVICSVDDNEPREYLEIRWDFAEGPFQGSNRSTFDRAGWWPSVLFRSYKDSALSMFKAFKTAVEESNPGYVFQESRVHDLIRKRMGVVLGEKEYQKNDGSIGRKLYVAQVRSVQAIEDGDYKVPPLKTLELAQPSGWGAPQTSYGGGWPSGASRTPGFQETEDDGKLPF